MFPLARRAGRGFIWSTGNGDESDGCWSAAGEVVLWVFFFLWAVWILNAFLPPAPDQTSFEAYLGRQLTPNDSGAAAQSRMRDAREPWQQRPGEDDRSP